MLNPYLFAHTVLTHPITHPLTHLLTDAVEAMWGPGRGYILLYLIIHSLTLSYIVFTQPLPSLLPTPSLTDSVEVMGGLPIWLFTHSPDLLYLLNPYLFAQYSLIHALTHSQIQWRLYEGYLFDYSLTHSLFHLLYLLNPYKFAHTHSLGHSPTHALTHRCSGGYANVWERLYPYWFEFSLTHLLFHLRIVFPQHLLICS